ncbi:ATP synthase subunit I [Aidingimonas lacisalsi]|uniref:ATP synthase subunit I n=1 Tax=Aidingimonas lacisalsi TaxID=2604086 RepID=UPI0011D2BCB9|nr:ATP synthase subunit I [Aidingimonas lacisalsi]
MQRPSPAIRRQTRFARVLWGQAIAVMILIGIALLAGGAESALSVLKGGLVGWLPNGYFVWRSGLGRGGRQPQRVVTNLYRAEAGKFGLTVVLFAVVFITVPPSNLIFFFSAYLAVIFMHWVAPWLVRD